MTEVAEPIAAEPVVRLVDGKSPPLAASKPRLTLSFNKKLGILALGLSIIAGELYGYYWWTTGRFLEATDNAFVGGEVTVIAPKVAGLISEVLVADNQSVRAGDLLVRIDDKDYRAALARAEANIAAQQ